ncbi:MAG: hypothetical protein ACM3PO_00040 [Betaproteobacteria bacterium]
MLAAPNLPKLSRNWPLVAIAGAAGFGLGIALFALCGASWIVAVLTQTSTRRSVHSARASKAFSRP